MADDLSDDSDNDQDWEEMETEDSSVLCLFCEETFRSCEKVFQHCKTNHEFDIRKVKMELRLDCFSYIKLINYIRKEKVPAVSLSMNPQLPYDVLTGDKYMVPSLPNDGLLMFDIEDVDTPSVDSGDAGRLLLESQNIEQNHCLTDGLALACKLQDTEKKLRAAEEQLQLATSQINKMRDVFLRYLESTPGGDSNDDSQRNLNDDDDSYFGTYAHFNIHHEMLQDHIRTNSYMESILENRMLFDGKVILDVGCGTGILSMFAAKGGASQVIGVDSSDILYQAIDIIRENDMQDVVKLVKGRVENSELPVQSVDIIISEWMGYFLLFESMLDSVLNARDKYLKPGGRMLPNRCTITVAGLSDMEGHKRMISFWDDVYGFRMTSMKGDVVREANVEVVSENSLMTDPAVVLNLNLESCTPQDAQFSASFQLRVLRNGLLTGLAGWFDTYFDLPHKVILSTSPAMPPTHWKQTVFYLANPFELTSGSIVNCKLSCTRWRKNPRALKVCWSLEGRHHKFIVQ